MVRTGEPGGPVRVTCAPSSTAPFLSITVPDKLAVLDCCESLFSGRAIASGRGASGRLAKSTVQPSLFGLGVTLVSSRLGSWALATPASLVPVSNATAMKIRLLLNGSSRSFFHLHIGLGELRTCLGIFQVRFPQVDRQMPANISG